MKKLLLILCVFTANCFAGDDECPPAAEMAEAQNHNLYKNCDYSKSGLNGVLHRALEAKKEAVNTEETKAESAEQAAKPVTTGVGKAAAIPTKEQLLKAEFSSAQQLQNLRYNLIQQAAQDCPKGFLLESEKYIPVSNQVTKLELLYHCL